MTDILNEVTSLIDSLDNENVKAAATLAVAAAAGNSTQISVVANVLTTSAVGTGAFPVFIPV